MIDPLYSWDEQGCFVCRSAWLGSATAERPVSLGVTEQVTTEFFRCRFCGRYWETGRSNPHEVSAQLVAESMPDHLDRERAAGFVRADGVTGTDLDPPSATIAGLLAPVEPSESGEFDDAVARVHLLAIEAALIYVGLDVDDVFVWISLEGRLRGSNVFARVNGHTFTRQRIADAPGIDAGRAHPSRQDQFFRSMRAVYTDLTTAYRSHDRAVPTETRLHFHLLPPALSVSVSHDIRFGPGATRMPDEVFRGWFDEVETEGREGQGREAHP